jgi:hypothetical protein
VRAEKGPGEIILGCSNGGYRNQTPAKEILRTARQGARVVPEPPAAQTGHPYPFAQPISPIIGCMADQSIYLSDEILAAFSQLLEILTESVFRPQLTEIMTLSLAITAIKNAHPGEAAVIDQHIELIRHSEDMKKSVDGKMQVLLKTFRSLAGENPDRVFQELMRQFDRAGTVN